MPGSTLAGCLIIPVLQKCLMHKYLEIALTGWFLISLIPVSLFAHFPASVNDRDNVCELPGDAYEPDPEWLKCCEQLQSEGLRNEGGGWEIPI